MRKILTVLLSLVFLFASFTGAVVVFAGVYNDTVVGGEFKDDVLDTGSWYTPVQNPGVEYNKGISFKSNSTKNSSVFVRTRLESYLDAGFDEFLAAEIDFTFSNYADGVKFGFIFGRSTLLGMPVVGKANSSFVFFTKIDGELKIGVSKYNEQGQEVSILEPKSLSEWIKNDTELFRFALNITSSGDVQVKILQGENPNTDIVYTSNNANLPLYGYVGFGQTGSGTCVDISYVKIDALFNSVPENSTIYEDFFLDSFNLYELYTRAPGGDSYIKVQNGQLLFKNIYTGYLSTKQLYSNFDLTMDLTTVGSRAVFDDDWNLVSAISSGISIYFGVNQLETFAPTGLQINIFPGDGAQTTRATHTVVSITENKQEITRAVLPADLHVFDGGINGNKPVGIKLKNTDGVITLYIQIGDNDYKKAFTYDSGLIKEGYIRVGAYQQKDRVSNFAIDRFVLANTDYMANIVHFENKDSSALNKDFIYIDTWDDNDLLFPNKR